MDAVAIQGEVDQLPRADPRRDAKEDDRLFLDHALLAEGTQLSNPADYVRRMNRLLLNIDAED